MVKKVTKQFHAIESIEVEIYDSKRVSYKAKILTGKCFIPFGKESVVEILFEENSVIISAPLSTYKTSEYLTCD